MTINIFALIGFQNYEKYYATGLELAKMSGWRAAPTVKHSRA